MDKLTQLLNERYPMRPCFSEADADMINLRRKIFSEGYNARIAEEKSIGLTNREVLERDYNPSQDHSDFHTIK